MGMKESVLTRKLPMDKACLLYKLLMGAGSGGVQWCADTPTFDSSSQ